MCLIYLILIVRVVIHYNLLRLLTLLVIFIASSKTREKAVYSLTKSLQESGTAGIFFGWNSEWFGVLRYFKSLFSRPSTQTRFRYRWLISR